MTRNKTLLTGIAAAAVGLLAIGGGLLLLLGSSEPASVDLDRAVAAAERAQRTIATTTSSGLEGTWTLVDDGTSFVGYRVQEELAGIGATTAVGRTTAVAGSLTFDGDEITAVSIEADVSQLQSDQSRRDMALRQQALETAKYTEATFALTDPIALEDTPAEGELVAATATGTLTLHGVSREVEIPLQGQIAGGRVVVVGSTEVVFADYGIAQPRAAAVLSVADRATLELQLVFERVA